MAGPKVPADAEPENGPPKLSHAVPFTRRLRRHGIGTRLVEVAARQTRAAGPEWSHVDFEDHLRSFYFGSCGFRLTNAGLISSLIPAGE